MMTDNLPIYEIDSVASYAGEPGHDPNIFTNRVGDLICVYGDEAIAGCVSVAYSQDSGQTWTKVRLVTKSAVGTGILLNATDASYWVSAAFYNETMYLAIRVTSPPGKTPGTDWVLFTKCDVRDVTNVADYTNWKSADSTAPASEGSATDGNGIDILGVDNCDYPSIDVIDDDTILIAMLDYDNKDIRLASWDGAAWTEGQPFTDIAGSILDYEPSVEVRHTEDSDWLILQLIYEIPGTDYAILRRCIEGADPMVLGNWTNMNALKPYDYVLDNGFSDMSRINMVVDANNYIHVFAKAPGNGNGRIWHNYYKNDIWVNGSQQHDASSMILVTIPGPNSQQPDLGDSFTIRADASGELMLFTYADGKGMCCLWWKNEIWDASTWFKVTSFAYTFRGADHLRNFNEKAPTIMEKAQIMYFVDISGMTSGHAWWDEGKTWDRLERMQRRLNTPYENSDLSNNVKLLKIVAKQKGDIDYVYEKIYQAGTIEEATGISLDRHGKLIACYRHTDETDGNYRNRLRDYLHSIIGGGTHEQLRHTIEAAIPGITSSDYEIIDGYGTSAHGDPNHYAHIKIRINLGFDWVINNLYEMLDRARAACITIDEFGPLVEEILVLTENVTFLSGVYITENITLSETIVKDIDKDSFDEVLNLLEPRAGSMCHYCDITKVDSLNYLCS